MRRSTRLGAQNKGKEQSTHKKSTKKQSSKKQSTKKQPSQKQKKSLKRGTTKQAKTEHQSGKQEDLDRTLKVWNPISNRLVMVGGPTYKKLLKDGDIDGTEEQYVIKRVVARWDEHTPKKAQRIQMQEKFKEVFMLPPRSQLPPHQKNFNKDDVGKYVVSTAANPGKIECQGLEHAATRLSMNKIQQSNPAAHAFILDRIKAALSATCAL